jgi:hypothetical protein
MAAACRDWNVEVPIRTMRDHRLTRREMELDAIEMHRHNVRFERDQIADAAYLSIGFPIRPCRETRLADVVITA